MIKMISKKQIIFIVLSVVTNTILMGIFYFLDLKGITRFDYYYLSAFIGAVLIFLGWVIPNHFEYDYRRKTKKYKETLPQEIKQKKFGYRFPLMISGIISLIISSIFSFL